MFRHLLSSNYQTVWPLTSAGSKKGPLGERPFEWRLQRRLFQVLSAERPGGSRRGSRGPPKVDRPHANRTSDYDMPLRVEGRPAPGTGGRSSPILGPSTDRRRVPRNAEGRNKELEFTRSQPLPPKVHRTPHFSNQTQIAAAVN